MKTSNDQEKISSWKLERVGDFSLFFHGMSPVSLQLSSGSREQAVPTVKMDWNHGFLGRGDQKRALMVWRVRIIPIFLYFLYTLCPEGGPSCRNCIVIMMELKIQENPNLSGQKTGQRDSRAGVRDPETELEKGGRSSHSVVLHKLQAYSWAVHTQNRPKAAQQSLWEVNYSLKH